MTLLSKKAAWLRFAKLHATSHKTSGAMSLDKSDQNEETQTQNFSTNTSYQLSTRWWKGEDFGFVYSHRS